MVERQSMERVIEELAMTLPGAQESLDRSIGADAAAYGVEARRRGLSSSEPLVLELAPRPIRIVEHRVEAELDVGWSYEVGVDIALRSVARPVHRFFEARYGHAQRRSERVVVECRAIAAGSEGTGERG